MLTRNDFSSKLISLGFWVMVKWMWRPILPRKSRLQICKNLWTRGCCHSDPGGKSSCKNNTPSWSPASSHPVSAAKDDTTLNMVTSDRHWKVREFEYWVEDKPSQAQNRNLRLWRLRWSPHFELHPTMRVLPPIFDTMVSSSCEKFHDRSEIGARSNMPNVCKSSRCSCCTQTPVQSLCNARTAKIVWLDMLP